MGNRLSAIATRTGDDGTTGLGDGSRTPKTALRVIAIGEVDELNSFLGVLALQLEGAALLPAIRDIQNDLFDMGGELSIPGYTMVTEKHLARLDALLAEHNANLPRLAEFILPGGNAAASHAHVCRAVCRRVERNVIALAQSESLSPLLQQYLNRLSDLLFVLSRVFNNGDDVLWVQKKNA